MKILIKSLAICLAAGLAGTALAQQQSSKDQKNANSQSGSANQGNSALQQAQAQEFFRASDIIGKSAQTRDNQKIGSVKDVVFNQSGQVFALIDVGNSRWAAVPWEVVNVASAKGKQNLTINTTQQALKSGPVVTENQWGALDNPSFVQGIYSYYHIESPSAAGGSSTPGGANQGQEKQEQK